jgi:thiamine-monophosphate kinase
LLTAESGHHVVLRPQYRTGKYAISTGLYRAPAKGYRFPKLLDFDLRDERAITERLRQAAAIPAGSPVILGIGDDCAIYRPRGSADDLLFTSDMFIEGVHFLRETHKPAQAGRKALARSLSDIAAMGGAPRFCLVSLCVPGWANAGWVDRFFDAILNLAATAGTVLAGGDLSHGETLACDVTVCGAVPRGTALRRSGARPGNDIYVSGTLGGSALGLATNKGKARQRHLCPEPRLALGRFLREHLRATSAIDLSDGLSLDLRRVCLASGVEAEIVAPPRFPGTSLEQALHGGEEYELLFTVSGGVKVPDRFEGLPLTPIGSIVRGGSGVVRLDGKPLQALGYDHFGSARVKTLQ